MQDPNPMRQQQMMMQQMPGQMPGQGQIPQVNPGINPQTNPGMLGGNPGAGGYKQMPTTDPKKKAAIQAFLAKKGLKSTFGMGGLSTTHMAIIAVLIAAGLYYYFVMRKKGVTAFGRRR